MHGNGVGPAPHKTHTADHDRKAPEKGETARTVTKGAAPRFIVAQLVGRRAALNPDRQVVSRVGHRVNKGWINATGRGDDAELLPDRGRYRVTRRHC